MIQWSDNKWPLAARASAAGYLRLAQAAPGRGRAPGGAVPDRHGAAGGGHLPAVVRPQPAEPPGGRPGERGAREATPPAEQPERLVRRVDRRHARGARGPQAAVPRPCRWWTGCARSPPACPTTTAAKRPIIERIHRRLANLPQDVPADPGDSARPTSIGPWRGCSSSWPPAAGRPKSSSCSRSAALIAQPSGAGILPAAVGISAGDGDRPARTAACGPGGGQSGAAPVGRPARGPGLPLRRPQRLLPDADLQQGRHLEHGRHGAVRPAGAERRPATRPATRCRSTSPRGR